MTDNTNLAGNKLEFVDVCIDDEFIKQICIPYFEDIYKDLESRSDMPDKGINKSQFINYSQLPVILGERFFYIMDTNQNGYITY